MNLDKERALLCSACNAFVIDCSDIFAYNLAESVTVSAENMGWMTPMLHKYGAAGLLSCIAYIEGREPIEPHQTASYNACRADLNELQPTIHLYP